MSPAAYRYVVRSIHGAAKLESELIALSSEAWEPVNLQRDGSGTYEVVLRQELNGRAQAITEEVEVASVTAASPVKFLMRSIHGFTKIESELTNLSRDAWEPLSFQLDADGRCDILLRQHRDKAASAVSYEYRVQNIHGGAKLESELTNLSNEHWEPLYFQHDAAGTYHVILRQTEKSVAAASFYRYSVRRVHGATKLESDLTDLSAESWEPLSFARDAAGTYEVILRQKI